MKFYESKEFIKLNRQWRKKLRASSFKDIERSETQLSVYSYQVYDNYDPAVEDYYSKAQEFLNSYQFSTQLDQFIWQLHSEGKSYREISFCLEESKAYPPLKKDAVG
jgi:hypothetical protein